MANLQVIEGGLEYRQHSIGSDPWALRVRSRARILASAIDTQYMELANLLYMLYDTPIDNEPRKAPVFTKWGYTNFYDYAEAELGLHRQKANRLRMMWFVIEVELNALVPEWKERLVGLGLHKITELCKSTAAGVRVMTIRNVEEWVERAEVLSNLELRAAVSTYREDAENLRIELEVGKEGDLVAQSNQLRFPQQSPVPEEAEADRMTSKEQALYLGASPPEPEKIFQKVFAFYAGQLETVKLALMRAEELSGSKKRGHNMALICLDFLANNGFREAGVDQKLQFIAKMERVLGVRLVGVDKDTGDVLYGVRNLEFAVKGE